MLRAGSNINQLTKYAISKHLLFEGPKHKKRKHVVLKAGNCSRNFEEHFWYKQLRTFQTLYIYYRTISTDYDKLACSWQLNVQNSRILVRIFGHYIPKFADSLKTITDKCIKPGRICRRLDQN